MRLQSSQIASHKPCTSPQDIIMSSEKSIRGALSVSISGCPLTTGSSESSVSPLGVPPSHLQVVT